MNQNLFNFFYGLSGNSIVASLSIYFSYGLTYLFIFLIVVWSLVKKGKKMYAFSLLVLTGISSWLLAHFLKFIFHIQRPFIQNNIVPLFHESGYSFPSEHTAVLTALAFAIYSINKRLGIICFIFMFIVALSRIIIGVHYPIDILGGIIVGLFTAYLSIKIFNKIK